MPKKYLQIVPSSDPAGPSLSAEIAQAFEQIRERAHQLYKEREACAAPGDAAGDWLRAERELFTVPAVELIEEPDLWRLSLAVDARAPEARLLVGEGSITVLGEPGSQQPLFCHLELPGVSEARLLRRGEALIEVALPKKKKAMAAAASSAAATSAA